MADRYWVGNGGRWYDDATHWATTSGGSPGSGNLPTSNDNAIFDDKSFSLSSQSVTSAGSNSCYNLDFRLVTNNPNFSACFGNTTLSTPFNIYGNLYLSSNINIKNTGSRRMISFLSSDVVDIDFDDIDIGDYLITFNGTGTFNFLSGFTSDTDAMDVYNGTLNFGSYTYTMNGIDVEGNCTLNFDTSIINLIHLWDDNNLAIIDATSNTFNFTNGVSDGLDVNGNLYNNINITTTLSQSWFVFDNSGTINNLTVNNTLYSTFYLYFRGTSTTTGGTYSFTNAPTLNTDLTHKIAIWTVSSGTAKHYLFCNDSIIEYNYLNIKNSSANGSAIWYACNCTDSGNNDGWLFECYVPPTPFTAGTSGFSKVFDKPKLEEVMNDNPLLQKVIRNKTKNELIDNQKPQIQFKAQKATLGTVIVNKPEFS